MTKRERETSAKRPTTVRLTNLADRQIRELQAKLQLNQTDLILLAIDRLHQQEIGRPTHNEEE